MPRIAFSNRRTLLLMTGAVALTGPAEKLIRGQAAAEPVDGFISRSIRLWPPVGFSTSFGRLLASLTLNLSDDTMWMAATNSL
jgi:hypothetical protein